MARLLKINTAPHEDTTCIDNEHVNSTVQDAETQFDPKVLFDAETQCETKLKRSISIQNHAQ